MTDLGDTPAPERLTDVVAIDGPAGAGKSSAARRVAGLLGFAFLDTGAMYRAATWNALKKGVDLNDPLALAEATRAMRLELLDVDGRQRVLVDGHDITAAIRTPEVTRQIHRLDRNAGLRGHLVLLQRRFAQRRPTVAEGRDMGTVVFPAAKCKIYLDASIEERVKRRASEMESQGLAVDRAQLQRDISLRDQNDMNRDIAPLRPAEGATFVDTTGKTHDEVVAEIVRLAKAAL